MDSRRPDKRRPDREYQHSAKKPRLETTQSQHRQQHNGNGNSHSFTHPHYGQNGPSPSYTKPKASQKARYNPTTPGPTLKGPLPPLPPISEAYAKPTFTHPSRAPREHSLQGRPTTDPNTMQSYDRLEFLGDAYLEVIATRLIFSRYPSLPPGQMSSLRERMVRNSTLAAFSVAYGFDKRLDVDHTSMAEWRRDAQTKVHGDVLEAYVAAVVLSDAQDGFRAAEEWLTELWAPMLEGEEGKPADDAWKERLFTRVGYKGVKLAYVEERPMFMGKGVETYFVGVYLTGWGYENQLLGSGQALSKKAAGMEAARKALEEGDEALLQEIDVLKAEAMKKDQEEREAKALEKEKESGKDSGD
ncbi:uncharacterized protein HMPREF1541_03054 [Cyphellophora europaea CBS 101466]|uniref:RNase III domain-containing protein n=1 Tax=Cyphellophora europaea (strain CBS 101466) TaxID=1220924 RepID=W2RZK5_CYPE1|nr:uncharacterized protein HMPREF1541_03054 [Cyphellophora europaea CBS 101466]ETN41119.1 hypothetical protein HMPREF1541_03054 [Cyphellophora europaea CBS 101466]